MEAAGYDLVVIGMGAAGLAAAVSHVDAAAAEGRAARVGVVERAPEAERGGATRYTSSWFRVTEDRRLDPGFVSLMESVSGGLADLDYCRTLEREVPATLEFLDEPRGRGDLRQEPLAEPAHGRWLGRLPAAAWRSSRRLAGVLERTDGVELTLRDRGRALERRR